MNNNNIKSITARLAIAVALLVGSSTAAFAKKTSVDIKGRESSGFNGLEHVLQKPLGNPAFPEGKKGLGNNLYIGLNGGTSIISNEVSDKMRLGFKLGGHIGGWFTPVHGIRLTGVGGRHSVNSGVSNAWYGSLRADYMVNLSALLYGYDPDRVFELIGGAGLVYQLVRQNRHHSYNYGAAASLQMRFNVGPTYYLFMEPELNMLAGRKYNSAYPWERMYTNLAFNIGVGYRILTGKYRKAGATNFFQSGEDNIFAGVGGGGFTFLTSNLNVKNPHANIFAGKMFSSTSGLQVSTSFIKKLHGGFNDLGAAMASLDYVLNLNNALSGYRPRAPFQMFLNLGVSGAKIQEVSKVHFGAQAGLMGLVRISDNWGIFIHPQVSVFSESFTTSFGIGRRPLLTADLGLRYTIGDYTRLHKGQDAQFDNSHPWFLMVGGGAGLRLRFERDKVYDGFIGIGRQFTPLSALRLNLERTAFSGYNRETIGCDYLTSISTAMAGYNPYRIFDLEAFGGLLVGSSKFDGGDAHATFGVRAGLKGNFRVSSRVGIFLEPQLLALYGPIDQWTSSLTPEIRMQLGVQYKF
ncbi:MAG: hypothetical protein HDS65_02485 [Bacteroidales bacterium]|nr:hypothetical protein [Bacteroidales bacterium]